MPRRPRNQPLSSEVRLFLDALPESARPLLESRKGTDVVEEIGLEVVRGVVLDVMSGINIRDSTEPLTRRRIALLNAAMVAQYASAPDSEASLESLAGSIAEALEKSRVA